MVKFRNQLNDLASNVETWWLWGMETLTGLSIDETTQNGLLVLDGTTDRWLGGAETPLSVHVIGAG